ncbi:ABC transporter permease subunit [[Mycoplasma] anseris]|uniref:ABC transporter permease subunit n=1 Tax=[Mycoplasma] anseris TaxID=92400 RepID=A0A2Z4NDE3_9BACT|nr:ABC transporter permease subunit [[Mycoplasma] anseris]AWX69526.1 ABC transporter permease subunit [[Mycoplasma] anseris]
MQETQLFKFAKFKPNLKGPVVHTNNTKSFWKKFFDKKINIFIFISLIIILLSLIIASLFIKNSPSNSIFQQSDFVNNLPSQYTPIIKRSFERGEELEFIRFIEKQELIRSNSLGIPPVFKILFDSSLDVGGSTSVNTDIVTLWYNPYQLIEAINLNVSNQTKISIDHFLILGTNQNGVDIYSRIFSSIWLTFVIILLSLIFNIFIGFSLGAIVGLKSDKWYAKIIEGIANVIGAIPELIWIFMFCIFLGTKWYSIVIAFVLISWTHFYETTKNETKILRNQNFISAAISIGLNPTQLIFKHVWKQIFASILILIVDKLAMNLLIISSLSLLDFITNSNDLHIGVVFKEALLNIKSNIWYLITLITPLILIFMSLKLFFVKLSQTYNQKIR